MGTTPSQLLGSPVRLLSCIRFDEVCVLQGAPLIGAVFSMGTLTLDKLLVLAAVVAGSLALVAHVFVLNDSSGIEGDLRDPARASRTFLASGVRRTEVGYLAIALLAVALLVFWLVGATAFCLALAI